MRYFAHMGRNHIPCTFRKESVPGSTPGKRCPEKLASPFTPYNHIDENAVVWTYFVWLKAERLGGSNPRGVHTHFAFRQYEGAVH